MQIELEIDRVVMYDCFVIPSSVVRALPVTCTFQVFLLAIALLSADLLAFTGDELPTYLGCLTEGCPQGLVCLVARFESVRGIFIYLIWWSDEVNENLCELRYSCPHFPCCPFATAGEEGDRVAPC